MPLSVDWSEQAIADALPSVETMFALIKRSFLDLDTTVSLKGKAVFSGVDGPTEYRTTLQGSDFVYSTLTGSPVLTGGDVESLSMGRIEGGKFLELAFIEGQTVLASDIFNAGTAEASGADSGALENLFMGLGWKYNGTDLNDIFRKGATSADGASLEMTGNDDVKLQGGNDDFYLGKGNDRAQGGSGNDSLYGAAGKDRLRGNSDDDLLVGGGGNDKLFGGGQKDKLLGGSGADFLNGGNGNDRLIGGKGADTLIGGGGGDVFVFGNATGEDRIDDYTIGTDRVKINSTDALAFEVTGEGLLVSWGLNTLLLSGITSETDVDFV